MLSLQTRTQVISYCNRDLVPDTAFNAQDQYHSQWFEDYFSFLNNKSLSQHLGEAFYQARFIYKLMSALNLPVAKQKGIIKFQIIQYASICEAILDFTIEAFHKDEALTCFSSTEFIKFQNALSISTKISYENEELVLCKPKIKKGDLKRTRVDFKSNFAVGKGISDKMKNELCELYDLRNNVHILKASNGNYTPRLYEARNAFHLMQNFIEEIKTFFAGQSTVVESITNLPKQEGQLALSNGGRKPALHECPGPLNGLLCQTEGPAGNVPSCVGPLPETVAVGTSERGR